MPHILLFNSSVSPSSPYYKKHLISFWQVTSGVILYLIKWPFVDRLYEITATGKKGRASMSIVCLTKSLFDAITAGSTKASQHQVHISVPLVKYFINIYSLVVDRWWRHKRVHIICFFVFSLSLLCMCVYEYKSTCDAAHEWCAKSFWVTRDESSFSSILKFTFHLPL